jgi:ABC-type Fe3+-siderophore transport system permease subunit
MVPRWKQRVGGLFMALLGAGFTGWSWYTALYQGYFYRKASMLFPAVFILGLGMIIFPGYKEERIARGEDISRLQGWKLITPRWWAILIAALVAGGANYMLLSSL